MRRRSKAALAALLCLTALAACRTGPAPVPSPGAPPAAPAIGGRHYGIVADESLVQILVFRAGVLAKLGHDHLIASHDVQGSLRLAEDVSQSSFELRMPVRQLTVDEPQLRARLGAEWSPEVPETARESTRRNMLGPAVLDGERYPWIVVRCEHLESRPQGFEATLQVELKGRQHTLRVPLRYEAGADRLIATTEFALRQTEIDLVPFSALLGALQVADELQVSARIVARATTP